MHPMVLALALLVTPMVSVIAEEVADGLSYTVVSRTSQEKPQGTETRLKIRVDAPEKPADDRLEALAKRAAREQGQGEAKLTVFLYSPVMKVQGGGFAVAEFSSGEFDHFVIPCGCIQWQ